MMLLLVQWDVLHNTFSVDASHLSPTQGCPPKVGQPWAALHNAFSVRLSTASFVFWMWELRRVAKIHRLVQLSTNSGKGRRVRRSNSRSNSTPAPGPLAPSDLSRHAW